MLNQYLPVLIVLALGAIIAGAIIGLTHVFSPNIKNRIKSEVYESGLRPQMDARLRYPIRFYVVAMMFILFDVEVIFLYPWAVEHAEAPLGTIWKAALFIGILAFGLAYAWRKRALEWR